MSLYNLEFSLLLKLTDPDAISIDQLDAVVAGFREPHFDHKLFLQMVRWHRVTPQVCQKLLPLKSDLPVVFFESLQQMNARCRVTSLKLSAWLAKMTLLLGEQNIEFISLKGIGLSEQLYGKSGYRQSRDIDILIESRDIDAVEEILGSMGFERSFPPPDATSKQVAFLNSHKKDREYLHHKDGTIVEVHWRLTEVEHPFNPSLYKLLATGSSFTVHGQEVTTVSGKYLWLYQSLHGSYSGWYRLRWICDIAQLLCHHKPDWSALLESAEKHHCKNSLLEAIGMACTLYNLPLPDQLKPLFRENKPVWKNIETCSNYLIDMKIITGLPDIGRIHFWAPKKSFVKFLFTHGSITPSDFSRFKLPDALFFIYYLIRPMSFIYRQLIRTKRDGKRTYPH